jgi:23S rRNA U2552 (ribose-2'-O)-methylase RlmE/FtsJ
MRLKTIVVKLLPNFLLARFGINFGIGEFAFDKKLDVRTDIKAKYGFSGELLELFVNNKNQVVHKWHHYIPIYDKYFARFRGRKIRFLEIGVSKGGSLQMWRKYFGEEAIIFGIDIDPKCAQFNGQAGQVRIGSQDDPIFLESVINEMGGVDLILDDGSHHMDHIQTTLNYLFPKLSDGGSYMIEDLHTAYWKNYGGGYRAKSNFFGFVSDLVDDMHHWYHLNKVKQPSVSNHCASIHIHDSIVVIEKDRVFAPTHSEIS